MHNYKWFTFPERGNKEEKGPARLTEFLGDNFSKLKCSNKLTSKYKMAEKKLTHRIGNSSCIHTPKPLALTIE